MLPSAVVVALFLFSADLVKSKVKGLVTLGNKLAAKKPHHRPGTVRYSPLSADDVNGESEDEIHIR